MTDINDLHGGVRRSAIVEYCRHCKHLMTPDHECADHCKGCADLRDEMEALRAFDYTEIWKAMVEQSKKHTITTLIGKRPEFTFPDRPIIPRRTAKFDCRDVRPEGEPISLKYSKRFRQADDRDIFFQINKLRESGDAMMQIHDEFVVRARLPLNLNVDTVLDQEWVTWVPDSKHLRRRALGWLLTITAGAVGWAIAWLLLALVLLVRR